MGRFSDAWDEEQRRRWMRPDAHLWIATDPERFGPLDPEVKRILDEQYEFKHGRAPAQRLDRAAQRDAHERALIERMRVENEVLRDEIQAIKAAFVAAKANFDPAQPRDEIGRWTETDAGGNASDSRPNRPINDPRILSDATPDNDWKPGAQYAQNRGRQPTTVRISGRLFEMGGGQAARLAEAQSRAEIAFTRVREIDPKWKPSPSAYETPEGLIRTYQKDAAQAEARIAELASRGGIGPGSFGRDSFPPPGPGRPRAEDMLRNNENGNRNGCHTCGTFEPGTRSGNWVYDHQDPTALNRTGRPQRIYPQCKHCSVVQGGWVNGILRRR
jgi:hypothetical protein